MITNRSLAVQAVIQAALDQSRPSRELREALNRYLTLTAHPDRARLRRSDDHGPTCNCWPCRVSRNPDARFI